jgi:hypothetical protein
MDLAYGIAVRDTGAFYLTGASASTNAIASPGSLHTSNAGDFDAFLARFSSHGVRQWASYYGGSGTDVGGGLAIADSERVYVAGYTSSPAGIATSGAYQTSLGGLYYDAFLAKFDFCVLPVIDSIAGPVKVCPGATITLADGTPAGTWSSSNIAIATVSGSGVVTGVVSGADTIIYTIANNCGSSSVRHPIMVLSGRQCHDGVDELPKLGNGQIQVLPNPNDGHMTVLLVSDSDEEMDIVITDVTGRKIGQYSGITNHATTIATAAVPGIYVLTVRTCSGLFQTKVVVAR